MNKQNFIEAMEELQAIKEAKEEVAKAWKKLNPHWQYPYNTRYEQLAVELLRDAMNDEYDWIGYFIYETDWGKKDLEVTVEGVVRYLRTPEDVYNVIKK